jgi:hypothetical protein
MKLKLLFPFLLIAYICSRQQTIGFKENKGQIIDQNGKPNDAVKYLLNSVKCSIERMDFHRDVKPKNPIKQRRR